VASLSSIRKLLRRKGREKRKPSEEASILSPVFTPEEIQCTAERNIRINNSNIKLFGSPHMIIDDIFDQEMLNRLIENWPDMGEFTPEVKGMNIISFRNGSYESMADEQKKFWEAFNKEIWTPLMATLGEAFSPIGDQLFGGRYFDYLQFCWPLTLMETDDEYAGHKKHTHFWNAPHWAITILFYLDGDDDGSNGTSLHKVKGDTLNSYSADSIDKLTDLAMGYEYMDRAKLDNELDDVDVVYKSNRLLCFFDGPLGFHSVKPTVEKQIGRRRVLRTHLKVHHDPFYRYHNDALKGELDPTMLMKTFQGDPGLSQEELVYRSDVLRPFVKQRISSYASVIDGFFGQHKARKAGHDSKTLNILKNSIDKSLY
jgi:hypothetical protein